MHECISHQTPEKSRRLCMCVHLYGSIGAWVDVCMCVWVYVCMRVYACVCMCVWVYECIAASVYECFGGGVLVHVCMSA